MKAVRWSGLIAFIVILATLFLGSVLFLDNWAKAGIEAGGTRVHGAEVNVASVDLSLNPLGFDVRGVQITDKENPQQNLFELDRARLAIDLPKLFLGKVSIDDLTVAGMSSGTERREPGRVLPVDAEDPNDPGLTGRAQAAAENRVRAVRSALPEPESAVKDALSQTLAAADQARTRFSDANTTVGQALDNLPDDASLAQYDRRIEALRDRSLNSIDAIRAAQSDLTELQREATEDQQAVATARRAAADAVSDSRNALETALQAPARDWAALREAYPLNQASAVRAGRLLLGDAVFDRYDQARKYYTQAAPWLRRLAPKPVAEDEAAPVRLDGRFVRFDVPSPTPNFLLRRGLISFESNATPWALVMNQVTGQQRLTGEPVQLNLSRGDAGNETMSIDAVLDRRQATNTDQFDVLGRNLSFAPRTLDMGGVNVDWSPGTVDLGGALTVTGDQLEGQIELIFSGSSFEVVGDGQIATTLGNALQNIRNFDVGIRVSGAVAAPDLQLTSDLDNQIQSALSAALRAEYDRWMQTTRARLDEEADNVTDPLRERFELIESQGNDVKEQADEFQRQVIDRLAELEADLRSQRDRLGNAADAERDRAEDKARRQAEDAVNDLKLPGF